MLNVNYAGMERPRVGVSSCLLGALVRFNGGHKRHRFLTDELGRYVGDVILEGGVNRMRGIRAVPGTRSGRGSLNVKCAV